MKNRSYKKLLIGRKKSNNFHRKGAECAKKTYELTMFKRLSANIDVMLRKHNFNPFNPLRTLRLCGEKSFITLIFTIE